MPIPATVVRRAVRAAAPRALTDVLALRHEVQRLSREVEELRVDVRREQIAAHEQAVEQRFGELVARISRAQDQLAPVLKPDYRPQVGHRDRMWHMPGRGVPFSCTDEEGLVLFWLIRDNGLTSGFEIATAFGFSSAYIAAGLAESGGSLVSLDCYAEELTGSAQYSAAQLTAAVQRVRSEVAEGRLPEGLATARRLSEAVGTQSTVRFGIGLSPQDVSSAVDAQPVDLAFIDGGHEGDQPTQDFLAIAPLLRPRCLVAFHDNYPGYTPVERAVSMAEQHLGVPSRRFRTRNHLTVLGRGIDSQSIDEAAQLVAREVLDLP